jgi:hypothetical protein
VHGNLSVYVTDCISDLRAGRFLLYAVNITTLADVPHFPVLTDGHHAVNDPKKVQYFDSFDHVWQTDSCRYFVGGIINQRVALMIRSGTVVGGFGSICDSFYTGMLVGVMKSVVQ